MAAVVGDRYLLKSIHEEIDLFDRKLAHLKNFEKFDSEEAREAAQRKMLTKRKSLVETALRLAAEGVEFKAADLPRSLRPADDPAEPKPVVVEQQTQPQEVPETGGPGNRESRRSSSPYAGTSLDWQASVLQYMRKKGKA